MTTSLCSTNTIITSLILSMDKIGQDDARSLIFVLCTSYCDDFSLLCNFVASRTLFMDKLLLR